AGHYSAPRTASTGPAFARALQPGCRRPRRGYHYWRTQPLAIPVALGAAECERILSDCQLVGPGAGALHLRHRAARAGVSLAWPWHSGMRPGACDSLRRMEVGNPVSHFELYGARSR